MENNLKKVLLISSYAPPAIGGPQMLYNLLQEFPSDKYVVLTSYKAIDDLSALRGTWLSGEYVFYDNPQGDKEARMAESKKKEGNKTRERHFLERLKVFMKKDPIMKILAGIPHIFYQTLIIIKTGKRVITSKYIDVLMGFSDYGPAMLGTFFLHKLTKKPYYIFLFDLYRGNFYPFPGQLLARIFEKSILSSAEKIIVTNQGTQRHYENLYGKVIGDKIVVIHNSIFVKNKLPASTTFEKSPGDPFTILFTGRISWPQLGALKNMIRAVNEITDNNIIFKIYSPSSKDSLKDMGITESEKVMLSFAPPEDIAEIQQRADVLFLPLSWHTKGQAVIDTATPGKMTDYLMAGKPILVHAPPTSFLVNYARQNNFAAVVDSENMDLLKASIKNLIINRKYSLELVRNAKDTFNNNHDIRNNALIFKSLFVIKKYDKKSYNKLPAFIKILKTFSNPLPWIWSYLNLLDYKQDIPLKTRSGITISVADKDGFGIVNEIFCEKIYTKWQDVRENDVVVDIGANLGAFTMLAARQGGKVFGYEPVPENYQRLIKNISQNNLEERVRAFNKAVASDSSGRKIYIAGAKGHHTASAERKNITFDYKNSVVIEAPSITLAQVFNENNIEKCMFLKMDCEGSEYEILLNTPDDILRKTEYMALEYHDGPEALEKRLSNLFSLKKEEHDKLSGMLYARKTIS